MATQKAAPTADDLPSPLNIMILGWFIPGAGHWCLGMRKKAILFFVILNITFLAGFAMAEFRNVSADRHPWYFLGQAFFGIPTVVSALVTNQMPPLDRPIPSEDMGTLFTCVASLLNALLFLDAFEIAEKRRLGLDRKEESS